MKKMSTNHERLTVEDAQCKLEETKLIIEGWIMSFEDFNIMDKLSAKASKAISSLYDNSRALQKAAGSTAISSERHK